MVTGAAANIAFEQGANLACVCFGVVGAQVYCAHHHAGRAIAALQAVALFERGLHGVHGAVGLGQAFNGSDLAAVGLGGQHIARLDGAAVLDDRAGAALGGVATHMGAGELQVLPQHLHQQGVRRYIHRLVFSIDLELNLHATSPIWLQ